MKKIYSLILLTSLCCGSLWAGELTVADGTATNDRVPVYSDWADMSAPRCQIIYPASDITDLKGKTIESITFYVASTASKDVTAVYTVGLATISQDHFKADGYGEIAYLEVTTTTVYEGAINAHNSTVTLTFSTPFTYEEDNLFIDIKTKTTGTSADATFYGVATGAITSRGHSGLSKGSDFLPKTTFVYEGAGASCAKPKNVKAAATPDGAIITWEKGGEESGYQYALGAKDFTPSTWTDVVLGGSELTFTISGQASGDYDLYLRSKCSDSEFSDGVKVSFTPECGIPTNVRTTFVGTTKATLAWDAAAGVSKYQYILVRKGAAFDWEGVEAKEVLSVSTDTLKPSTAYVFYVRSFVSADYVSGQVDFDFTTNCELKELGWSESFSAGTLPACWEIANASAKGWELYPYEEYSIRYNSRTSGTSYKDLLKTPAVAISENALLKFQYKNPNTLTVNLYISKDGGSTKTLLKTYSSTVSAYTTEEIGLADYVGKDVLFFFECSPTGSSATKYFYIDNFSVAAKGCADPTNLQAVPTDDGAVASWEQGNDETQYQYCVVDKDAAADGWILLAEDVREVTITGKTLGQAYDVYVRSYCSASKQSEPLKQTFTTACLAPADLAASEVTSSSAKLSWKGSVKALQFRAQGASEWTNGSGSFTSPYELASLSSLQEYEVRVQASCAATDAEGWTDPISFTTKSGALDNAIPYSIDFEAVAVGALPDYWERRSTTNYPQVAYTTGAYGGDFDSDLKYNCLMFYADNEQIAILPAFNANLKECSLGLDYKNGTGSALELGYLKSLYGAFTALESLDLTYSYADKAHYLDLKELPNDALFLAIRYTGANLYSNAFVDNVSIIKTIDVPTAIETIGINANVTKRIENGQLVIIREGEKYNAQGAKVDKR